MATAYTATIKVSGQDGWTYAYAVTSSDVAGEYWLFPDGASDVVMPSTHGRITVFDVIASSASGTTKNAEVFVGGVSTGIILNLASILGTNFSRQLMGAPIVCGPGSRLRVIQRA
jgi:hypothetical protein